MSRVRALSLDRPALKRATHLTRCDPIPHQHGPLLAVPWHALRDKLDPHMPTHLLCLTFDVLRSEAREALALADDFNI